MKILLAEDEAIIAMRIEMELMNKGHEMCKPVSSGEAVVRQFETESPDLVIMDLNLIGKMNGIEAARQISSKKKIPLIFMTGYQDEDLKKEAMKLNPVAYLIKPVDSYDIASAIDSIIR